jgi:hypothetical protein
LIGLPELDRGTLLRGNPTFRTGGKRRAFGADDLRSVGWAGHLRLSVCLLALEISE